VTDLQNNLLLRFSSYKGLNVVKIPHAEKEVEGQKGMTATAAIVSANVAIGLSRRCITTHQIYMLILKFVHLNVIANNGFLPVHIPFNSTLISIFYFIVFNL
jgi:hypothetical protein